MSILVGDTLEVTPIHNLNINKDVFESCAVLVGANNRYCNVVGVYRPPNASLAVFNETFRPLLQNNLSSNNVTGKNHEVYVKYLILIYIPPLRKTDFKIEPAGVVSNHHRRWAGP